MNFRFNLTQGSRWCLPYGLKLGWRLQYPSGAQFTLQSYNDRTRKLVVYCPEHQYQFTCDSDARRYERNGGVTGTFNLSQVERRIDLVEAGRDPVYFIMRDDRYYYNGGIGQSRAGYRDDDVMLFSSKETAWIELLLRASKIYHTPHVDQLKVWTLWAYDPRTESRYMIEMPAWKHRALLYVTKSWAGLSSARKVVKMIIRAEHPLTVARLCDNATAAAASRTLDEKSCVRHGSHLFFQNEEVALLTKMAAPYDIELFAV